MCGGEERKGLLLRIDDAASIQRDCTRLEVGVSAQTTISVQDILSFRESLATLMILLLRTVLV
jgi:hypothetical protein